MSDDRPLVVATFPVDEDALANDLGGAARVQTLSGLPEEQRAPTLRAADVILAVHWRTELRPDEGPNLDVRFVQLLSAGADDLPFDQLPRHAQIASNAGAYAEPMAEHAVAMALALIKRLPENQIRLASGVWDHSSTRWVNGSVWGILGFGGIGKAIGRLVRALGGRVHGINTSGRSDEPAEFVGTLDDLDTVLAAADVVVISLPLTRRTRALIGVRELELMKPSAILVNVARGAIVDETSLYEHLQSHSEFSAGIDAWWGEPFRAGEFHVDHPFFELPNLLGSPHNSGLVPGIREHATSHAAANILRFLQGERVTGLVRAEDYVPD
jgi:phosphoglycerate dehydrogenase-like enzyme